MAGWGAARCSSRGQQRHAEGAQGRCPPLRPLPPLPGHIFAGQLEPPAQARERGRAPGGVLNAAGTQAITGEAAAEAAAVAYGHARAAVEEVGCQACAAVDAQTMRRMVCRLQRQACVAQQQRLAAAGQAARRQLAGTALARCLADLQALGCPGVPSSTAASDEPSSSVSGTGGGAAAVAADARRDEL